MIEHLHRHEVQLTILATVAYVLFQFGVTQGWWGATLFFVLFAAAVAADIRRRLRGRASSTHTVI